MTSTKFFNNEQIFVQQNLKKLVELFSFSTNFSLLQDWIFETCWKAKSIKIKFDIEFSFNIWLSCTIMSGHWPWYWVVWPFPSVLVKCPQWMIYNSFYFHKRHVSTYVFIFRKMISVFLNMYIQLMLSRNKV